MCFVRVCVCVCEGGGGGGVSVYGFEDLGFLGPGYWGLAQCFGMVHVFGFVSLGFWMFGLRVVQDLGKFSLCKIAFSEKALGL